VIECSESIIWSGKTFSFFLFSLPLLFFTSIYILKDIFTKKVH
jgi:hypothetical protein